LNDDIHWWYVFVGVILAACLIVASSFAVVFFTKEEGNIGKLWTGCLLTVIGVSLVAVWSAIYFVFLYKKDNVTTGNDGVGFMKATRKQEVVITLYVACCIDALFAYFLCIVSSYQKAVEPPQEEEMMMDDDKMSKKSGKSNKGSDKMDGMMMEEGGMM